MRVGPEHGECRPEAALVTSRGTTAQASGPYLELVTQARRLDAVSLLTCYLFLLMAIPSSLVFGSFGAAGAPAAMFAVALFCWYLMARQHPSFPLHRARQPVRAAAILFGCAVIAAYVSANRAVVPGLQENGADRGLIMLSGWLGVLLLAADGIDRMGRLRTLLRRVVIGATAMAVLGAVEFCTGVDVAKYIWIPGLTAHTTVTDLVSRAGLPRVRGTAAQPLEFASVLAMSLPLAIHQARFAPAALRGRRWLQVALVAGAALLTVSRSTVLAFAVVGIVLLPTWSKRDWQRAYLITLVSPVLLWLVRPNVLSRIGGLFGQLGTDQSSKSRTGAYAQAATYISQHPWFGHGLGTFFPQTYFFTDNQYLISLIETGVVGTAALLALFAAGWSTARSARRAAADAETRDLANCLAASVAAAVVCFGAFDALSFSIASGFCFLLLGCIAAVRRLAPQQRGSPDGLLP
jgi:polysaccharide biosynthesis protein PslJ